jgi:aspartyl-tRNA(Asn)/glutamyl-tRNA(Gln) amidotransferase subunit A
VNADTLFRQPVPVLRAALTAGRLSSRALTEHYLERIARLNPSLKAFCFVNADAGIAADEADARRRANRVLGPLDGLPVAVKDNLWVAGMPATWGSPLFRNFVAPRDEVAVATLRQGGAVLLGKTNCPEFAMRGVTVNSLFGATANPWDITRTPGGSSGGAVAAVAAGLTPLALATDGGGSIRRPAAHTGLVGFKPSVGRVPRGDGFPETLYDCEVIGPVARDVEGARLLFDVLATPPASSVATGPRRILFAPSIDEAPVDPAIVASCRTAVDYLRGCGHQIVEGAFPFDITRAIAAWSGLGSFGLAQLAQQQPDFFALAAPDFVDQARAGQAMSAAEHAAHIQAMQDFRAQTADFFRAFDILVTPAIAAQSWPLDQAYPPLIDGKAVGPRGHAIFTGWVNAAGLPAIALPTEPDTEGMPVGIQLVGAQGADDLLFTVAENYEAGHAWTDRWPTIASR